MTAIAGFADRKTGKVWIGADSLASSDAWHKQTRRDPKVFATGRAGDRLLIGFTTSYRMGQLIRYKFTPPEHPSGMDVHEYLCSRFADGMRQLFKDNGFLYRDKEQELGGQFLVGYRGGLYCFHSDFSVGVPDDPFDAVGCGEPFALGAMSAATGSPKQVVLAGLRAAEKFSAGVGGPFVVLSV